MKVAEIRKLETDAIIKQITDVRLEISELKKSISMGETSNVRSVRNKRKQLSRMLTIVSEKLAKENI